MNTQKLIITFLIVFFSLFFIIATTYHFPSTQIKESDIPQTEIWMTEFVATSSGYSFISFASTGALQEWKQYKDVINFTDTAYILGKGYSKNVSWNNVTFWVKNWGLVLFDLYDISNNYIINGEWFKIKVKSPGKMLVDTRERNVKIFSLSSVFSIDLLNEGKEMTTLALHPKMFFSFNESRNKFLKNADLLRLETLTSIFYFNDEILSDDKTVNPNFLKKIWYAQDKKTISFFQNVFGLIFSSDNIEKYNEENIKQQLIPVKDLGWTKYIDEYFLLFLNDQKKVAYYKKKVVANLNRWFDKQMVLSKGDILNDINAFKELNENEFHKFLPVLYFYYNAYLKINSLDYIKNTTILSEIIMEVNGNKKDVLKSYFYLNKIYSLVNNKTFDNGDLQSNFLEFLKLYFDEKHISLNGGFQLTIKDIKMVWELDYMSLFIKNILIHDITFSNTSKLVNVFWIFKIYASINENINTMKNNSKAETIIVENNLIIEKILKEMRENFFETDLNQKSLLVLKNEVNFSVELVNSINVAVEMFFHFYDLKKWSLSEKNQIYSSMYTTNKELYTQYFLAISNYPEYEGKYDLLTKELFNTKTILENKEDIVLSRQNLLAYLSQFESVDTSAFEYAIVGKTYYKITNINVNGELFSFNLYPKDANKMKDIYRNGEKLQQTYELDLIEDDLLAASEWLAADEDGSKYDFKKFFLNTFFAENKKQTKKFVDDEVVNTDSKNIQIFKRDKLLWERWEFSLLKGYMDMKYNNIEVTENRSWYDIVLKDVFIETTIKNGDTNIPVVGQLTAQYVFSSKDHYFKNIAIQFLSPEAYSEWDMIYMFDGKTFNINKNINIVDFKSEMNSIILDYFTNN